MLKRYLLALTILILLLWSGQTLWKNFRRPLRPQAFKAERAYQDVVSLTHLGPRTPGSDAHRQAIEYIRNQLQKANWEVLIQTATVTVSDESGQTVQQIIRNIIARRSDVPPRILLGTHYDSRLMAERDPDPIKQTQPVPGANDGASGVAVLLELARVLPADTPPIWLVFFDAEDQGSIPGWQDWALGSRAFVEELAIKPDAVVVVDMVGDYNLKILPERQSNKRLVSEIWSIAHRLGYQEYFLETAKYAIHNDHLPFLRANLAAALIIDIEYRYWHTSYDTADKVSPQSLGIVGSTLQAWLEQQR